MTFKYLGKQPPKQVIFMDDSGKPESLKSQIMKRMEIQASTSREEHFRGALKEAADDLELFKKGVYTLTEKPKNKMEAIGKGIGTIIFWETRLDRIIQDLRISAGDEE